MSANRWRRFADWDNRPLRLDRFAVEDAENGFAAFRSPHDPKPGIAIEGGRIVGIDGVAEADFDMIDNFIRIGNSSQQAPSNHNRWPRSCQVPSCAKLRPAIA